MGLFSSLILVLILALLAGAGVQGGKLHLLFGVILPYAAICLFLIGVVARVVRWARSPVPFRIPTTCGQQKSLGWIKHDKLEAPSNTLGVLGRMALEILCFRSLFRNTRAELKGDKLVYGASKWLWGAGLIFHWAFLIIFLRHFKFFSEPVPFFVHWIDTLDGFFQVGLPVLFITDLAILGALTFLFLRRVLIPQIRYISLASDFFPLFLLLGIATSGVLMRYFIKVDVLSVKELGMGLISFNVDTAKLALIGWPFYVHLFLVTCLIAYFPWSKLMHLGGVFLSPTRNLANNNRTVRHAIPWTAEERGRLYPNWGKVHHYHEWEEEFRDKIESCGLPLDKE